MNWSNLLLLVWLVLPVWTLAGAEAQYEPSATTPPSVEREFRGAWVATVQNIDWPSKVGLPVEQQKAEMLAILDKAVQLKLNAILFQVRPAGDALYASKLEPWSEYLTGQMGLAPSPFYDPLEFVIDQAHKRGLELHAWFNPFRARHASAKSSIATNHFSRTHPGLVRTYGKELWMDPGERGVQEHSLKVILDVVKRYDIDGVHLDDYFYPYPEKLASGKEREFTDAASYKKYTDAGGKLGRGDWRRANINGFVEKLYSSIKAEKKYVKFGISPFGIWRPGFPPQIKGFDAYDQIYADSLKWLVEGWLDYLTPQLYWSINPVEQSYPVLLKWWAEQNTQKRHLWPGDAVSRIGPKRPAEEIINQIKLTRKQVGATGTTLWNFSTLLQNKGGICDLLQKDVFAKQALIPRSPWLGSTAPGSPMVQARAGTGGARFSWQAAPEEKISLWVFQQKVRNVWTTEIFPGAKTDLALGHSPEAIALSAVDRFGNISKAMVLQRGITSP
ncbi:MAG: hypothetical protein JWM16_1349 [Verrucomicrobiales bacterium]|nr:hypothetical protein [Verrucomicrobiales bacterium]